MRPEKYTLTFACYNAVQYTQLCIESLIKHGTPLNRLVVVDNGSSDSTRDYLSTLPLGGRIFNQSNLGCGVAWNQGALALQSEWTIIMNNDVLVSADWIKNLIHTAESHSLKVISPALIEGPLDYDFEKFYPEATLKMQDVHRIGARHAVCLAVHQSVWSEVGYFQPIPKLLGYEDTLFFHELDKAKINTAMTGAAWLHHYGSITQTLMKQERGLQEKDGLGHRYNYKLLQQSWLKRKLLRHTRKSQARKWALAEIAQYQQSIHGLRENGQFRWI